MEKNLKDKAIDIKGKKYVQVSHRIIYFNDTYKDGCINTELVSPIESDHIIIKATVYPEGLAGRRFTGYSQAIIGDGMVNKTSALENAETSAVGRALALMGIGVIDSVASVDEINKAVGSRVKLSQAHFVPLAVRKALSHLKQETLIARIGKNTKRRCEIYSHHQSGR